MKILYFNPKNCRYITAEVLKIEGDIVYCLNKKANYQYTESLTALHQLTLADNPNWHGKEVKPLVKLIGL